jgi:hypothetical protein
LSHSSSSLTQPLPASLPPALLLWSLLTFVLSLSLYCGIQVLGGGAGLGLVLGFALGLLGTVVVAVEGPRTPRKMKEWGRRVWRYGGERR